MNVTDKIVTFCFMVFVLEGFGFYKGVTRDDWFWFNVIGGVAFVIATWWIIKEIRKK